MPESLIPIAEIAQFIIDLQRDVRELKQKNRLVEKEFQLGASDEPQDIGGQLPATTADYKTPITAVTSIIDETCILVRRQIPDAGGEGWADDPVLISLLEVTLPSGISPPPIGSIVQPIFTGLFQINTLSTTVSLPRYGLFSAPQGTNQFMVINVAQDHLDCRRVSYSGSLTTVVDSNQVFVAKQFELQVSRWQAAPVEGITYVFSTNFIARTATSGSSVELHRITPNWINSFSIIQATRVVGGTGIASAFWMEMPSRQWAVV